MAICRVAQETKTGALYQSRRMRCMQREMWKLTLPFVKQIANRNCCMAKETQTMAMCEPRGMG